ncbi:nitronate monooxygenase family protein [Pseudonocardia sp. RS11V-5]|uniref:NAD(P)H-dependent flavin oxidoreductase n=1 Tax=Pseudonocardia terrae TaxID=2905831 RepID=UPI001E491671|nr:nitronate monooxygenase family protein [Pseudonocardia terrae]MCE3551107.1 nitronate monooxygenase family protein [Pseudonocardia terrae]
MSDDVSVTTLVGTEDWIDSVLATRLTTLLGIRHPVVQAGMGYLARQELAAAVSEAGGLGVIGSTGNLSPEGLREEIRQVKALTRRPFAVNLLFPRHDPDSAAGARLGDELRDKVAVVIDEGVAVLGAGLGVPDPEVFAACRAAGVRTMCTVGATRHAEKAQQAGADVLVAQGWEAGGHNSRVASMALLPQVCRIARVPVVAAGGIGGGAGLVAALALGASGAYLGTVFAASAEARAHERYKDAVLAAADTSTVVTRAHSGKPARMVRNAFTEHYRTHPEEIGAFPEQWERNEPLAVAVRVDGDVDRGPIPAGQIAGLLDRRERAADVVERVVREARHTLAGLHQR